METLYTLLLMTSMEGESQFDSNMAMGDFLEPLLGSPFHHRCSQSGTLRHFQASSSFSYTCKTWQSYWKAAPPKIQRELLINYRVMGAVSCLTVKCYMGWPCVACRRNIESEGAPAPAGRSTAEPTLRGCGACTVPESEGKVFRSLFVLRHSYTSVSRRVNNG